MLVLLDLFLFLEVLRQARGSLAEVLRQAGPVYLPSPQHVPANECLGRLLPAEPSVPGLPAVGAVVDLRWIEGLSRQMGAVADKLDRLRLNSLGGLLAYQEQVVKEWEYQASTRPAGSEVI